MEGRSGQQGSSPKWKVHPCSPSRQQGTYRQAYDLTFDHCWLQCDLASEGFLGNINQLDDYCREKGFHAWFETSAKENIGIEEAARSLVAKVCGPGQLDNGTICLSHLAMRLSAEPIR